MDLKSFLYLSKAVEDDFHKGVRKIQSQVGLPSCQRKSLSVPLEGSTTLQEGWIKGLKGWRSSNEGSEKFCTCSSVEMDCMRLDIKIISQFHIVFRSWLRATFKLSERFQVVLVGKRKPVDHQCRRTLEG